MSKFKIDKGVPLLDRQRKNTVYPWAAMEPGDSFFVAGAAQPSISSCAGAVSRRRSGWRFATRKVTEGGVAGVRVWRVS